jgi:hypothetical protein
MGGDNDIMAPELSVESWLNTPHPLTLAGLRGKVVAIEVFQMLCPGCVSKGLPQATTIRSLFPKDQVEVLGLHSVFEHHAVMTREALEVFLHEYRIGFPVAIDMPSTTGAVPVTMERYQMRGTPSLLLIDHRGRLRYQHFGAAHDMQVGAVIGRLLAEAESEGAGCSDQGCAI